MACGSQTLEIFCKQNPPQSLLSQGRSYLSIIFTYRQRPQSLIRTQFSARNRILRIRKTKYGETFVYKCRINFPSVLRGLKGISPSLPPPPASKQFPVILNCEKGLSITTNQNENKIIRKLQNSKSKQREADLWEILLYPIRGNIGRKRSKRIKYAPISYISFFLYLLSPPPTFFPDFPSTNTYRNFSFGRFSSTDKNENRARLRVRGIGVCYLKTCISCYLSKLEVYLRKNFKLVVQPMIEKAKIEIERRL